MKRLLTLIALLAPVCLYAKGLINDFEWLEPNNNVEVVVGETYQLKYSCSDNSLPFTDDYSDSWVHYDFSGGQHVVDSPIGYSIDEKGVIKGLIPGSYAIKFTGWIQPKSGVDKWLYVTVVSEKKETESNNTLDTANELTTRIRFGLYNSSDIDYFKYTNSNLKWGDNVTFKIHYYGSREDPFGYKWSTFCGTDIVGSGSLISQDQECKALVTYSNTIYLEVYYDQSRSDYFNYGEEFVVEIYINGIPAGGSGGEEEKLNIAYGHEYVDLGLPSGLLWATCNIGADTPEQAGNYFAWGEIEPNNIFDWDNYKWGDYYYLTKYNGNSNYGWVDNVSRLLSRDDAAHMIWGGEWRMPTLSEANELLDNCTFWYDNQSSMIVKGPNGNTLKFYLGGNMENYNVQGLDIYGYFWLSDIYDLDSQPQMARLIYACCDGRLCETMGTRCAGFNVRAVCPGNQSGIINIMRNSNSSTSTFDLQGRQVKNLRKGVNIIHTNEGIAKKILIK